MAEIAKSCHDIAIDAAKAPVKGTSISYTNEMLAKAAALDILVNAIEPANRYQIQSQVEKYLDNSFDAT